MEHLAKRSPSLLSRGSGLTPSPTPSPAPSGLTPADTARLQQLLLNVTPIQNIGETSAYSISPGDWSFVGYAQTWSGDHAQLIYKRPTGYLDYELWLHPNNRLTVFAVNTRYPHKRVNGVNEANFATDTTMEANKCKVSMTCTENSAPVLFDGATQAAVTLTIEPSGAKILRRGYPAHDFARLRTAIQNNKVPQVNSDMHQLSAKYVMWDIPNMDQPDAQGPGSQRGVPVYNVETYYPDNSNTFFGAKSNAPGGGPVGRSLMSDIESKLVDNLRLNITTYQNANMVKRLFEMADTMVDLPCGYVKDRATWKFLDPQKGQLSFWMDAYDATPPSENNVTVYATVDAKRQSKSHQPLVDWLIYELTGCPTVWNIHDAMVTWNLGVSNQAYELGQVDATFGGNYCITIPQTRAFGWGEACVDKAWLNRPSTGVLATNWSKSELSTIIKESLGVLNSWMASAPTTRPNDIAGANDKAMAKWISEKLGETTVPLLSLSGTGVVNSGNQIISGQVFAEAYLAQSLYLLSINFTEARQLFERATRFTMLKHWIGGQFAIGYNSGQAQFGVPIAELNGATITAGTNWTDATSWVAWATSVNARTSTVSWIDDRQNNDRLGALVLRQKAIDLGLITEPAGMPCTTSQALAKLRSDRTAFAWPPVGGNPLQMDPGSFVGVW